jgi:hypothetical protein
MVRNADAAWGDDRGAVLSPEELEEIEAALAEDQAGEVISGEAFLRSLRESLDRPASG